MTACLHWPQLPVQHLSESRLQTLRRFMVFSAAGCTHSQKCSDASVMNSAGIPVHANVYDVSACLPQNSQCNCTAIQPH
eukprot:5566936-Pleurochrysis_carterae.AAC.2